MTRVEPDALAALWEEVQQASAERAVEEPRDPARRRVSPPPARRIPRILAAAREYLEMDAALVAESDGSGWRCRYVDGEAAAFGLEASPAPIHPSPADRVPDGGLEPRVVPDAGADGGRQALPVRRPEAVGAYVQVPVRLPNGRFYGILAALRRERDPTLRPRDARVLGFLARILSDELYREEERAEGRRVEQARLRGLLDTDMHLTFQPIVDLRTGRTTGAEALARFEPLRSCDAFFAEAWGVGVGADLELAMVRTALARVGELPPGAYVSVNVSPETVEHDALLEAVEEVDGPRVVIEVTEHAPVMDYVGFRERLSRLRRSGARLAVDDAGSGYSGLRHILKLAPDILKLDMDLVRGVDRDLARQALIAGTLTFASRTGMTVVAEGIETEAELQAVRVLGVTHGQGYRLGRPVESPGEVPAAVPVDGGASGEP